MDKMAIYSHLPVFAQNLVCSAEGFRIKRNRYGKFFWRALEEYERHDGWSYERIQEFRDHRIQKIVKHCYETVPYYRELFNEQGIDPYSIKHIEDLSKLPILTKAMVKKRPEQFLSSECPDKDILTMHTSGTTGSGFIFKTTQRAVCEQWAVWWRYRRRLGIEFHTWCAVFGGKSVVPVIRQNPPYYRINYPGKQLYFSAYHMSEDKLIHYFNALEKYRPVWLHGYPSSISLLARFMVDHGLKLSYKVKWVTTGAENLLEWQKEIIKKAFAVVPYQHYGMSEGVANISEDRDHRLVVDEDYSCVEFVKKEDSNFYRIIGSSLTNYAMPLLRYDVGDIAEIESRDSRRVLLIDGRDEDYLVLKDGRKIGRLDHIFKDMVNIREAQIFQSENGDIHFRIVKANGYGMRDEKLLKHEIRSRLGIEPFIIDYLEKIERTKTGKLRFVCSHFNNMVQ